LILLTFYGIREDFCGEGEYWRYAGVLEQNLTRFSQLFEIVASNSKTKSYTERRLKNKKICTYF